MTPRPRLVAMLLLAWIVLWLVLRPGVARKGGTVKERRQRRDASVRAAIERSRGARLRRVERRLVGHLRYLRQHDRAGYRALVALLRRAVARESRSGR